MKTPQQLHVRVTLDGNQPVLELMRINMKVADITRDDTVEMLRRLVEWLDKCKGPLDLGPVVLEPSTVDAIEMTANFASTLRWCAP